MATIRVYELARELNMENKALLEKLIEMKLDVKTHMSSLDLELKPRIKDFVLGKKIETVVETRVQPTVIRRRVKQVKVEEEPVELADEKAEPIEIPEAAEPPTPELEAAPEKEAPPAVEPPPPEAVSLAPPEEPVTIAETAAPSPDTQEAKEEAEAALPKKEKPVKVVKKAKKETPAKIISLPKAVIAEAPKPKKIVEEPDAAAAKERIDQKDWTREQKAVLPEIPPVKEEEPKDRGKKKDKTKQLEPPEEDKFFKKKISFRRKEIIERDELYAEEPRLRKARKGAKIKALKGQKTQITTPKAIKRRIKIDEAIVLSDLAKRMGIKANEMIAKLMTMGVIATVNQTIDFETAALVAAEFDYELEKAAFEEDTVLKIETDDPNKLLPRPPVVTIMGHVDHGKTSLLDVIRKTSITAIEAGGITQHIGAYNVATERGQIVFLDTPGHEAFTAMRSRGAKITDIVVLVVAADDGVMPQTIEAVNHSRAAGVPIIVAVNKVDKAAADPGRARRQLADVGLTPEEWGGDTIFVDVSAKTQAGVDSLLEMILLQAELMDLKADPEKLATGHVIEAKLDSGRGPVATVLVQNGTLHTGDSIVCGIHYGKIRAMINDRGERIDSAGPSMPVELLGLSGVPMAGDDLVSLDDEKNAKQVSLHRLQKQRSKDLAKSSRMSLEKLYESLQAGEVKDLNLIIKADVEGSIEALRDSLVKLSNEEVKINVIHAATGTITESDVALAGVSDAIIIGFNVRPSAKVQEIAGTENVAMNFYSVIYDVINDVRNAIVGMMASTFKEHILGRAEVREVFHVPKVGAIGGSYVTDGRVERGRPVRVLRDGIVIYDGKISSLKRFKDDAKEVQSGYECGIGIENFNDIKVGDTFECYYLEEIKPELT